MSSFEDDELTDIGWEFSVDTEAEELHVERIDTGEAYVFDADGGLRIPGDSRDVDGEEIHALRDTLAAALGTDDGGDPTAQNVLNDQTCGITCDGNGGLTIEADDTITLEAPRLDLQAKAALDLETSANATVDASGVLTLKGSLVKLN